jgi:hypothetical protein
VCDDDSANKLVLVAGQWQGECGSGETSDPQATTDPSAPITTPEPTPPAEDCTSAPPQSPAPATGMACGLAGTMTDVSGMTAPFAHDTACLAICGGGGANTNETTVPQGLVRCQNGRWVGQSPCELLDQAVDTADTDDDVVGVLENVDPDDLSNTTMTKFAGIVQAAARSGLQCSIASNEATEWVLARALMARQSDVDGGALLRYSSDDGSVAVVHVAADQSVSLAVQSSSSAPTVVTIPAGVTAAVDSSMVDVGVFLYDEQRIDCFSSGTDRTNRGLVAFDKLVAQNMLPEEGLG